MRVAIMQPYFIPYAGYFRLFQAADLLVMYDCVQFPKEGWVHRNRLPTSQGNLSWITLPLVKTPLNTPIAELKFADNAKERWETQLRRFPLLHQQDYLASDFNQLMMDFSVSPTRYIMNLLQKICHTLQLPFQVVQSSPLQLFPTLKGQERVIAIANYFKASEYINLSGGKNLYDEASFKRHNMKLTILPEYKGSFESIFSRIFTEDHVTLKREIVSQS